MKKRKERSEEPGEKEPENAGDLRSIVAGAKVAAAEEETQVRLRTSSTGNRSGHLGAPAVKPRPKSYAAPDARPRSDSKTERKLSSGESFDSEFIPPPPVLDTEEESRSGEETTRVSNTLWGSRDGTVVEHLPPTNVARVRFPDLASRLVG